MSLPGSSVNSALTTATTSNGVVMVEDEGEKEEEKFDFSPEGEAVGYISLAQARLLAMQTARETPGNYGQLRG